MRLPSPKESHSVHGNIKGSEKSCRLLLERGSDSFSHMHLFIEPIFKTLLFPSFLQRSLWRKGGLGQSDTPRPLLPANFRIYVWIRKNTSIAFFFV